MVTTQALAIAPEDLVVGLGRGLQVIESFGDEHPRQTVAEASQRTGIPRSAARRHLLSLCHFGYAQTDGKLFWLTPRVLRLGQSYLGAARLPRLVQPFIQRLSMATGETVNVSVLDGDEVVYVARSNSPRLVSIGFHAGGRAPAHVVAPGVVLLASLDDAALDAWIAGHEFAAFTSRTVIDPAQFATAVRAARSQDHWIAEQQLDGGLNGVAMALKDRRGAILAAIGMTVPASTWPREAIEARLLPALTDTAQVLRGVL
ncbi:MAG: helix-turn-helix domain-containing protein [Burkholderiaceae bacterium]|nr:helix-turn-helix domain-containing protein [Burkholderiaceae bacterium]